MIADFVEGLTSLPAPVICLAVGLLACAETAAFIGLAVPGEIAVVFGGVLAFQGNVPLGAVMASAGTGAILGDSLGFYLGRRLRGHLTDGRVGRLMGPERVERTMARIRAGGAKAIVLGRFVGVLRAVMPFAAGASGLRYPRFAVASVLGASTWAAFFTVLGYLAGDSWRRVERYAGRASSVLAVVVVTLFLLVLLARKLTARQDEVRAAWRRYLDRPRVAAFRGRYRRQLDFLVARFRPGPAAGLQLTVSLVGLALLGYAVAILVGQVVGLTGLASLDRDVRRVLSDQPPPVAELARSVHAVLSPTGAVVAAAVVGVASWVRDRRPRGLLLLALAVAGSLVLVAGVAALVSRPHPLVAELRSHSFPAPATTVVAATGMGFLAVLLPRLRRWTHVVGVSVSVLGVAILAGLAEVMTEGAFLSDAVGGMALGALWGLAVATAVTTLWSGVQEPVPPDVPAVTRGG